MSLESIGFPPDPVGELDLGLAPQGRHAARPPSRLPVIEEALQQAMTRDPRGDASVFTAALADLYAGYWAPVDTADLRALLGVARNVLGQLSAVEALAYQRLSESIGEQP